MGEGRGHGSSFWVAADALSALLGVRVEVTFSDVYLDDVDGKSPGLKKTIRVVCLSQEVSLAEH